MAHPDFAKAWLAQRELGARAVSAIEEDDLRGLGDDRARVLSDALLAAVDLAAIAPARLSWSGLVAQQQWFARSRR